MEIDLQQKYSKEIDAAIGKSKTKQGRANIVARDGTEIYAYPGPYDEFSWGINTVKEGCVLRGIRTADGSDRIKMQGRSR